MALEIKTLSKINDYFAWAMLVPTVISLVIFLRQSWIAGSNSNDAFFFALEIIIFVFWPSISFYCLIALRNRHYRISTLIGGAIWAYIWYFAGYYILFDQSNSATAMHTPPTAN